MIIKLSIKIIKSIELENQKGPVEFLGVLFKVVPTNLEATSHTYTLRSELPAETILPSGDQAQCSRFYNNNI